MKPSFCVKLTWKDSSEGKSQQATRFPQEDHGKICFTREVLQWIRSAIPKQLCLESTCLVATIN